MNEQRRFTTRKEKGKCGGSSRAHGLSQQGEIGGFTLERDEGHQLPQYDA